MTSKVHQELPALEAWRGVAALLVLMSHAAPSLGLGDTLWAAGFMGVDLFFVLSGFVFAPYLLGERPLAPGPFWVRRVFRIWPAYALAVGLYSLLHAMEHDVSGPWLETLFFLHLTDRETAFALNPAFWSLVPEVQFYALFPLLVMLVTGFTKKPVFVLAALSLAALLARVMLGFSADRSGADTWFMTLHHLPGMLVEFLLGSLAYAVHRQRSRAGLTAPSSVTGSALGLTGLLSALAAGLSFHYLGDEGLDPLLGVAGVSLWAALSAALLLTATAGWQPRHSVLRGLMIWMGHLSFGVYLFHHAALTILPGPLAIPATLGFAAMVYWVIERPLRAYGRAWADSMQRR